MVWWPVFAASMNGSRDSALQYGASRADIAPEQGVSAVLPFCGKRLRGGSAASVSGRMPR